MYGWSDLGAYGEWAYFPGFGYGWAPFASMGWAPYSMGMWSWYPGMGYTWISGEPWGWAPYHFGSWSFSMASAGSGCPRDRRNSPLPWSVGIRGPDGWAGLPEACVA